MEVLNQYRELIYMYIHGALGSSEFSDQLIDKFKNEKIELPSADFEILDRLFCAADAFTTDPELIASKPGYYVDDDQLMRLAKEAIETLSC